jgi:hypothetical protein
MTNAETAARRGPQVFSARVAIILFMVGVFSFSAFITLSTFAPELKEGDARAHALSKSGIGYAGIVKLARAMGIVVNVTRQPPGWRSTDRVVVYTPDETLTFDTLTKLGANSTVLIVLPKWSAIPNFQKPGWVMQPFPNSEDSVERILKDLAPKAAVSRASTAAKPTLTVEWRETRSVKVNNTLRPGEISFLQTIAAPNITPVVKTSNGKTIIGVIRGDSESPDIYILSEPDLLNTHGIGDRATAQVAIDLLNSLRSGNEPVVFDVTVNGYARTRSLLRLAFEPPLLGATISFLLIAALIAWRAATRDGPISVKSRALAYGKRILADNSAALIRLAGREHTMSPRYADFIRALAAEKIGVARDGTETTSAELDRIAAARGLSQPFSTLAAEAASAKDGAASLTAARKLHAWIEEIIRATR